MYIELYIKRREADITQKDLAKKMGMSAVSYSEKERCRRDFTLREAKWLADYFDCTLDELFKSQTDESA